MNKRIHYDDLTDLKTSTQQRNDAQIAMVQTDIKRIDSILASGGEDSLKALHIELDGTYQNLIKNWGSSTYNYIQGHGYSYDYMGESALRENLLTIRGKLRGFLLQLSPNVEDVPLLNIHSANINENVVAVTDKSEVSSVKRTNMYDIIKGRKFDVVNEYARIWNLFNSADTVGLFETPLVSLVNDCLQFFPDSFKSRALTLSDFNNTYGFEFAPPDENVTIDDLVSYCEYVITLCDHLWIYASECLESESDYLRDDLYQTVASCMDELGFEPVKRDNITIYVHKDPTVMGVSEMLDESLAYDVKSYIHKQTKGDLKRKKTILKFLADDIEPQRNKLRGINKTLEGNLFQMLQKFVRHNNDDNAYIRSLNPLELELCYDDIYQMWLLAKMELDNLERKKRVESVIQKIND